MSNSIVTLKNFQSTEYYGTITKNDLSGSVAIVMCKDDYTGETCVKVGAEKFWLPAENLDTNFNKFQVLDIDNKNTSFSKKGSVYELYATEKMLQPFSHEDCEYEEGIYEKNKRVVTPALNDLTPKDLKILIMENLENCEFVEYDSNFAFDFKFQYHAPKLDMFANFVNVPKLTIHATYEPSEKPAVQVKKMIYCEVDVLPLFTTYFQKNIFDAVEAEASNYFDRQYLNQ